MASQAAIPLNEWHHVAAVYYRSTQTMQMFIDGVLDSTGTSLPAPNASTTNAMTIGNDTGSYTFNGDLDDLRIYSRALAPAEVWALFEGGVSLTGVQMIGGLFAGTAAGVSPGQIVVFQSSLDLATWTPFQTNIASGLTSSFTNLFNQANHVMFFRAMVP
jgi:hypothetical protein